MSNEVDNILTLIILVLGSLLLGLLIGGAVDKHVTDSNHLNKVVVACDNNEGLDRYVSKYKTNNGTIYCKDGTRIIIAN